MDHGQDGTATTATEPHRRHHKKDGGAHPPPQTIPRCSFVRIAQKTARSLRFFVSAIILDTFIILWPVTHSIDV